LINYWPIVNGNTVDYIGRANMTPMANVSFVPDRFGNAQSAVYLNNGYCKLPPGVYFNSTFTITTWIYPLNQTSGLRQRVLDCGNGPGNDNIGLAYRNVLIQPYAFTYYGTMGTSYVFAINSVTMNADQWSHLATVYDGSNLLIYVNGIQTAAGNSDGTKPFNVFRNQCFIGRSSWYPLDDDATAYLDDLKFFKLALTVQEILDDMN
jgi:hypothetical protein